MLMNAVGLQYAQDDIFRRDLLPQVLSSIDAGHPSALFPYQNVFNKYYGLLRSKKIGRLFPPVGHSMMATYQKGWGASYQLPDEAQRQIAQGASLQAQQAGFYRLARQ